MKNLLPTIVPLLVTIGVAFTPIAQAFIVSHPVLSLVLGAAGSIINHWIPSPLQPQVQQLK